MSTGAPPHANRTRHTAADLRRQLIDESRRRVVPLVRRAASTLPGRAAQRFLAIDGRNRALVLGGQAFTTVVPLLIIVAALASGRGPTAVADRLAARFHVTGDTAKAFRILFERPPGAVGTVTLVGVVLLVFSLLSLTRSIQRSYEAAWQLPPVGVRGTLHGATGMGLLVSSLLVLSLLAGALRHAPGGTAVTFVLRTLAATAVWLVLQSLLLSRRIPLRRLLPGAVIAGVGQALVSLYSALWMPHLVQQNADQYGIIGITFAMVTWLVLLAFCVVGIAVLSAEIGGAAPADRRAGVADPAGTT
jgi:membrane protein